MSTNFGYGLCKKFLVLTKAREVFAVNQVNKAEVLISLREGEILLNPGDIKFNEFLFSQEEQCKVNYIREITHIGKNIVFDDVEVVEGGKAIFNARLIKNIQFKITQEPICLEFSGIIGFKVIEVPFSGYIELRGAHPKDKIKLKGTVDGELDRPSIGIPFIAVNETGGIEESRLAHKVPGAVILTEKTIVNVYGEIIQKRDFCR